MYLSQVLSAIYLITLVNRIHFETSYLNGRYFAKCIIILHYEFVPPHLE